MSPNAIQLQCPNCGAQLQIGADLETFACAYCSTAILVQREGGTVSLRRVEATLDDVRDSTVKAAAELALARYQKELAEVESLFKELEDKNNTSIGIGIGGGGILALLGLILLFSATGGVLPYVLLLAAVYALARGVAAYRSSAASRLLPQIRHLRSKIEERRQIAEA